MNKKSLILSVLALTTVSTSAFAQIGIGSYSSNSPSTASLPNCHTGIPQSPLDYVNGIDVILKESLIEADQAFLIHPNTAYQIMKQALATVVSNTTDCQDLRSIVSRPVAIATLEAIKVLESTISGSDDISKARILYDFSASAVRVASDAARSLDAMYFAPYRKQWRPHGGFFTSDLPPFGAPDVFAQKLLNLAASTLQLVNGLGMNSESGTFIPYYGASTAYLPVAKLLVNMVESTLKDNLLILMHENAFIHLEVLKDQLSQADVGGLMTLPMQIQSTSIQMNQVANDLLSCQYPNK